MWAFGQSNEEKVNSKNKFITIQLSHPVEKYNFLLDFSHKILFLEIMYNSRR